MEYILPAAKEASAILRTIPQGKRSDAINTIAGFIDKNHSLLLDANRLDVAAAQGVLSAAMIDRLTLNDARLTDIANAARDIAAQPDPIGEVISGSVRPNGLRITKVRVPMGVVGIIYESRPNVTVDCAALCLRSANVCILRGGKEARHSNMAFASLISQALLKTGLPEDAVILLDDPDRSKMAALMKAHKYVDLIIPRGGEGLIKYVTENSTVPVVKHDKGVCHIFVDESADLENSLEIIRNAKTQRPGVCNALETLLVHSAIAPKLLPALKEKLYDVELRGCERVQAIIDVIPATDEDWATEYLSKTLAVKIVDTLDNAMAHIAEYGSGHSDAILTESYSNAQIFLNSVDSACVYVNASTRFTDGGMFGLGAEVGISTQKLHSRGPMGAFDLTTYKYIIYGEGQTRA